MTNTTPVLLERSVFIRARRQTVFSFFTESERFAAWWGEGSTIDARPGGKVVIKLPGGGEASGEVLEVSPPARIVLTYGFSQHPELPPGASRVSIALESEDGGTRVRLVHELPDDRLRDHLAQGWRYQLAVFAHVVAERLHEGAERPVDAWFSAWSAAGQDGVRAALEPVVASAVEFRDRFSVVNGLDDLVPHIAAAQRFMPGMRLVREGPVRQCHGTVLADWVALGEGGDRKAEGTNVFVLDADSRIDRVTGFWSRHPSASGR